MIKLFMHCYCRCVRYIASMPIKEVNSKYGMAIKRLLFTHYQGAGRGLAVLLVFKSSKNMEVRTEGGRGREREREREGEREGGREGKRERAVVCVGGGGGGRKGGRKKRKSYY